MQEDYKSSQTDLENLLIIDNKNAPAKRELQLVKNYIAEVSRDCQTSWEIRMWNALKFHNHKL